MGAFPSWLSAAFSRHHFTMPSAASTWHTVAPAFAAATVAAPVYPKRFSTLTERESSRGAALAAFRPLAPRAAEIFVVIHSQFTACSGNNPVCLKEVG